MTQAGFVRWQILRLKEIDARRVDPDQLHPIPVQSIDDLRGEGGEILVEIIRIGEGAGGEKHPLGPNRPGHRGGEDALAPTNLHADDPARPQVEVETARVDRGGVGPVVTGRVGVSPEVNGRVQGREGQVIPPLHVEQHFP